MKTKKIEIEITGTRGLHYGKNTYEVQLTDEQFESIRIPHASHIKVFLTFEVPLPEPSVSITPSKLKEIAIDYRETDLSHRRGSFCDFLNDKLFPDWEG